MKSTPQKTVSVGYFHLLMDYFDRIELDTRPMFSKFGIDESMLKDPHKRIDKQIFLKMYDFCFQETGDSDLGLHVGENFKPGHYVVLGYSIMNCPFMKDAVHRYKRYQHLVSDIGNHIFLTTSDELSIIWDTGKEGVPYYLVEQVISVLVHFASWVTGVSIKPTRVFFQHKQPDSILEHQRIFSCPVDFNQEHSGLTVPLEILEMPIRQANLEMLQQLDQFAEFKLIQFQSKKGFLEETKAHIANLLHDGKIELNKLAESMNIKPRTLQRKLRKENISYNELVDSTRKQLAMQYIKNKFITLIEIAFLLGYADQSGFQIAFKRWTGQTPAEFRKNLYL